MSTAKVLTHMGHRKQPTSQSLSISSLPGDMILDILSGANSFQTLQTLLQRAGQSSRFVQIFLLNKDAIYTKVAEKQFFPLEDALSAASMSSLHPPTNELDDFDDPTVPLELLSEREGNNKSLRVRDKGSMHLEERIQKLIANDMVVSELEKLFELRFGHSYKLSPEERAVFRQSLYRIWAFTTGVPRYGTRCVFDHDEIKQQYWETRFLWQFSARDICEMGKVYSFLVGLVIECCRRCHHQEYFEADRRRNDEEYLSDVIGYHISKGPDAVLELYRKSMTETNQAKISRRVAWGAVGYQRFLIGDLEYVWYSKYSGLSFRQKSFREIAKDAICCA